MDATHWDIEPHTLKKHEILVNYLQAWAPTLTQSVPAGHRILFIDGFAGPGKYSGGERGSPLLAIEALVKHSLQFKRPVECIFIEEREDRWISLKTEIEKYKGELPSSPNVKFADPHKGTCQEHLACLLDESDARNGKSFGPALLFLDQFGYSNVPVHLIGRVMQHDKCEVLTYLGFQHLNQWLDDEYKDNARNIAYGGDGWKVCRALEGKSRQQCLLVNYKKSLKELGQSKYVREFAMLDQNNNLLYWLFFCTNNLLGLEYMKKAMWRVDGSGGYCFSDRYDDDQLKMLSFFDDAWLSEHLMKTFDGKTMSVGAVREYVLTETPCYKWAGSMKSLQANSKLELLNSQKQISYIKDLGELVRFGKRTPPNAPLTLWG